MQVGQTTCRDARDCLTVWDVLARWRHVSLKEFQDLINGDPPALPPYERVLPHGGPADERTLTLRPLDVGPLAFREDEAPLVTLVGGNGRVLAANADFAMEDEHGDPIFGDSIYFLVDDVARVERSRFLAEPLRGERPPRHEGRALRARDAAAICGVGESTFWRWAQDGLMPRGIKISGKVTLWYEDEVKDALARIISDARAAAERGSRGRK